MAQDSSPGGRRQHPLERPPVAPQPRPPAEGEPPRERRVPLQLPRVRPLVTYALIALNVGIFILRALSPELDEQLFLGGANIPSAVLQGGEYHRLLTAMFLHAGIYGPNGMLVLGNSLHVILNMYILLAVGGMLEPIFGHARFAIIYLLGGLLGSVFSAVLGGFGASVGASGAVFAVLGAEFIYLYRHRALFGAAATAQMRSLIIWGLVNFFYGALTSVAGTRFRIDNWGHLGGLVGGLALAWFLSPVFVVKRRFDQPDRLFAEDSNPLARRIPVVLVYAAALVVILILASAR